MEKKNKKKFTRAATVDLKSDGLVDRLEEHINETLAKVDMQTKTLENIQKNIRELAPTLAGRRRSVQREFTIEREFNNITLKKP